MPEFASRRQLSGNKWQHERARRKRSSDYDVALATTTVRTPSVTCFFSAGTCVCRKIANGFTDLRSTGAVDRPNHSPTGMHLLQALMEE